MDLKRVGCARVFDWEEGRRGPKGNIRRGELYSGGLRLILSSEVSERSTNCHVFEPAYKQQLKQFHGTW